MPACPNICSFFCQLASEVLASLQAEVACVPTMTKSTINIALSLLLSLGRVWLATGMRDWIEFFLLLSCLYKIDISAGLVFIHVISTTFSLFLEEIWIWSEVGGSLGRASGNATPKHHLESLAFKVQMLTFDFFQLCIQHSKMFSQFFLSFFSLHWASLHKHSKVGTKVEWEIFHFSSPWFYLS